jgi:ubiquinone biosynthesis protein
MAIRMPRRIDRLLTRGEQGDLEVAMRVVGVEEVVRETQALVNRLIVAILVSGSLVSLGLLLTVYHPDWLLRWLGPLFVMGVFITVVGALSLAWRMVRGVGRPRR